MLLVQACQSEVRRPPACDMGELPTTSSCSLNGHDTEILTNGMAADSIDESQTDVVAVPMEDANHIKLRADNSLIMSATVYGGKAYRQIFVRAISEELIKADGTVDIFGMFTRASNSLTTLQDSEHRLQIPEIRSTLRKTLLL